MAEPTYISTVIVDQKDANFPQVTFCPSQSLHEKKIRRPNRYDYQTPFKTDVLERYGVLDYASEWAANDSKITAKELFDLATYDLWELIDQIYVRFFELDFNGEAGEGSKGKTGVTITQDNLEKFDVTIVEQREKQYGKCYTLIVGEKIRSLGIYYLKIRM